VPAEHHVVNVQPAAVDVHSKQRAIAHPVWSPGGQKILFQRVFRQGQTPTDGALYTVRRNGTGLFSCDQAPDICLCPRLSVYLLVGNGKTLNPWPPQPTTRSRSAKALTLSRGAAPHPDLPQRSGKEGGHLLARAGRALPRNLRDRQGLTSIGPGRADPGRSRRTGGSPKVPDRGDDLTQYRWRQPRACPLRAIKRRTIGTGGPCHIRATSQGPSRLVTVTHGQRARLTSAYFGPVQACAGLPTFQAGHAGSIPVARSGPESAGQQTHMRCPAAPGQPGWRKSGHSGRRE
jgi:hypothetical protein